MMTLVGLGNPGAEYAKTRHNIGFVIAEFVAAQAQLSWVTKPKFNAEVARGSQLTVIKPLSFMNKSGLPVRAVLDYFNLAGSGTVSYEQLYVVHDDLDLAIGTYKIQFGKGPHGHNGLLSLYEHLGSKNFWHVRVGVDGRAGQRVVPPDAYVLNQFDAGEKKILNDVVENSSKDLLALMNA